MASDDVNFRSAFWELYLHELLVVLGYSVQIHPELPTSVSTQPDFYASAPDGESLILEAVAVVKRREENPASSKRKQTVLDTIDKLSHPYFGVWLEEEGRPRTNISGRRIRDRLKQWLDGIDYNSCRQYAEEGRLDDLPILEFEEAGWSLKFRAYPLPPEHIETVSERLIHLHDSEMQQVDSRTPIREAVRRKATKYGEIEDQYIVAVNVIDPFLDEIDIFDALFGQEYLEVRLTGMSDIQHRMRRHLDGAWTSQSGSRNTRISGVLIGHNVLPNSVANSALRLYHNPWAKIEYLGKLSTLEQFVPTDGILKREEGKHPRELLGLPARWPHDVA